MHFTFLMIIRDKIINNFIQQTIQTSCHEDKAKYSFSLVTQVNC